MRPLDSGFVQDAIDLADDIKDAIHELSQTP
jgi:hypothetical protein